ncbi:MAG: hypothetical protein IJI14_12715 [Anaerolineaceae bacterium]|nr:hypothetical protein [Anaerolineaceae bacterium]
MAKRKNTAVRTGVLAWKVNLSGTLGLCTLFLALNIFLVVFDIRDSIIPTYETDLFNAVILTTKYILSTEKYTLLLRGEGLLVLFKLLLGTISIRRTLKPIDEITNVALELGSENNDFDEEKFLRLESAIDEISPTAENARLRTGDQQFAGLELAVNNLIERMRDSYRQQTRFVSDASHELRTPIAVIKGYADMLDRWGKTDEKVLTESIEAIKTESEHMNYLVEQLLFLARGDNGKTKMVFTDFNLSQMIHEVYDEYVMIDGNHIYRYDCSEEIPAFGDISMLKQTARILLDNAKKYTPEGGEIRISTALENNIPTFTIQDNGIGIDAESLPHIFDRFFRADSSRSRDTGGTGLGLAIARWIINKHNGRFDVLSREGIGTRITVYLPISRNTNALLTNTLRK